MNDNNAEIKYTIRIGETEIAFPEEFMSKYNGQPIPLFPGDDITSASLMTPKDEKRELVTAFLKELAENLDCGLTLFRFLDALPSTHMELYIAALIEIGFQLPVDFKKFSSGKKTRKGPIASFDANSDIIEFLMEKMPIPTDEDVVLNCCQRYRDWYIPALRRAVTLAHVSKKGLSAEVIKFIYHLTKTQPDLAFALSPTTLHDNTLVAPTVAKYFTCNPFGSPNLFTSSQLPSPYKSVVHEESLANPEIRGTSASRCESEKVAIQRIQDTIKCIKAEDGFFPWHHPEIRTAGVLLAGGLPCASTLNEEKWLEILEVTDIDLFVYGDSEEDRKAMTAVVLEHLESIGGKLELFKSVFQVKGLGRDIQVVCPYARSPLGVLINFDTTFIQIGYQENQYAEGGARFFATPGHCFFTHRSQSLITRYNVRLFRMMKLLKRGFTPVSDNRGHWMYPMKMFFSPQWQLRFTLKPDQYDEKWILTRTLMDALSYRDLHRSDLKEKFGNNFIQTHYEEALSILKADDLERYEWLRKRWDEIAEEKRAQEGYCLAIRKNGSDKDTGHVRFVSTDKPEIDWVPISAEDAMKNFHPEGATLSNGFDMYTAGVNSTLPLPDDGETDELGFENVLLRNVRVTTPKREYNLAAPGEKLLKVKHHPFRDESDVYPSDTYSDPGNEPVRIIEGIFIFGEKRPDEEVEKVIAERKENEDARIEKLFQRRKAYMEAKGKDTDDLERIPNKYVNPSKRIINSITFKNSIAVDDLHKFVTEPENLPTIEAWELPLMMQAFASGRSYYLSRADKKVKRKMGMVRVRATITFNPCTIFDMDDLFLPQKTLDNHPVRRYNAMVRLSNLDRWIIKLHEHVDLMVYRDNRDILFDVLCEQMKNPSMNPDANAQSLRVSDYMRAFRHVANEKKFEEICREKVCPRPHAHKGLPGHMPVLFCTRLYVSRHENVK